MRIYGKEEKVRAAAVPGLWHGSFKGAPGQFVLLREKGSKKPYDLGIFTLDTTLSPEAAIERYSWRRAIEPSNAAGKQVAGAGDALTQARINSISPGSSKAQKTTRSTLTSKAQAA